MHAKQINVKIDMTLCRFVPNFLNSANIIWIGLQFEKLSQK